MVILTGETRLPEDLGAAKHGRLKAAQWLTLFTPIIPLVIPKLYIESDESYQNNFNRRINTYTKKPMTWDQVTDLHNRGHVIGAHTLDHLNLAELNDELLSAVTV